MRRLALWTRLLIAPTLVLAACSSNNGQPAKKPASTVATIAPVATRVATVAPTTALTRTSPPSATRSRTPAPRTPTPSPTPQTTTAITGFGATDAVWNTKHKEANGVQAGSAYDPQSGGTPLFADVNHASGRVVGFTMQFAGSGLSSADAKTRARALLPSDVAVVYDDMHPQCEAIQYKSATLGKVFADPKIGDPDGLVDLTLSSLAASGTLDPAHVSTAAMGLGSSQDRSSSC